MSVADESKYNRSFPQRAMVEALRASTLARLANSRVANHEAVCAERYRWLMLWVKSTAIVVAASTVSLIAAMWQIIIKLSHLG